MRVGRTPPANRTGRRVRRGAATVEFALVAPVAITLVFAGIEFTRANTIRNTAENAAYEGARQGILPGATAGRVKKTARTILQAVGVNRARITVTPDTITESTEEVTVEINVPMNRNGWVTPLFFKNKRMIRTVTLQRERTSTL